MNAEAVTLNAAVYDNAYLDTLVEDRAVERYARHICVVKRGTVPAYLSSEYTCQVNLWGTLCISVQRVDVRRANGLHFAYLSNECMSGEPMGYTLHICPTRVHARGANGVHFACMSRRL